jgi:hypothetical protein
MNDGEHSSDSDDNSGDDDNYDDDDNWLKTSKSSQSSAAGGTSGPGPPSLSTEIYAGRLKRRIELIREMRAAYLRDVVLIKQLMTELLTNDERLLIFQQQDAHLPSLDLERFLLSRPIENSFELIPCTTCGGTVEIVHHDSNEIQKLTMQLQNLDQKKGDYRLIIATKTALLDELEEKLKRSERKFREEVEPPSLLILPIPFVPFVSRKLYRKLS